MELPLARAADVSAGLRVLVEAQLLECARGIEAQRHLVRIRGRVRVGVGVGVKVRVRVRFRLGLVSG